MRRYLGLALLAFPIAMGCSVGSSSNPQTLSGARATNDEEVTTRASALLASDVDVGLGNTNEPHLAISPIDQSIVAAVNCFTVSLSFDGGRTFLPGDQVTLPRDPGHGGGGCDSVMTFDAHGRLFVESLDFVPGGETDVMVQQVDVRRGVAAANRPVDAIGTPCAAGGAGGPNGQCPAQVTHQLGLDACVDHKPTTPGRSADRPWFVADNRPLCGTPTPDRTTRTCSPFQDHLYVIWLDSPCQGDSRAQTARVASSSDQGTTWISQGVDDPNDGNDNLWQYGAGIAANGDAYVVGHSAGIGEIAIFRSTDGTATGFAGNVSIPFPAPLTSVTDGSQQCQCGGSFCKSNPSQGCTFAQDRCPGLQGDNGAGCECPNNDCTPALSCPNQPIPGWQLCGNRSTTNGSFTPGTWSPYVVADPTNPNNIAVFATTDPNRGVIARDKFDIMYAVSTDAASAAGPSWPTRSNVTPGGMPLPGTNQIFGQAASPVPGINGSCVTLAYYDDRNPSPPNAFGRNFMDVFVTVNPNLWDPMAKWQNEVAVNHTKFDPDLPGGAGDRNFYCGNTNTPQLGCEPAGWLPSTRMGEYFGVLQAFGVLWTGNLFSSPGVVSGQTILFNFSDGINPVVTAPPTTTVSSCAPTEAQLGTATRTDECGMPPLGAATSNLASLLPLTIGPHTITWSATDGAGNTGSATQNITVTDASGPTFTVVPPDITITSCTGASLGQAFAQDDCGGTVTITNNAPARFPLGTTVVTWTARDARGNTRTATQQVTAQLGDDPSCCPAGTNIIVGTSNNDPLNGTIGADCILGRGGQDTINGNGGNDFISGGDGDDVLNGGDGNDVIYGGTGQDTINGNNGNDTLFGSDGDDHLFGGPGNDILHGGQGQDVLQGQDNDDVIFGDTGDDQLDGGNGNDTLAGGPGNDTCTGGAGTNLFEQCEFGAPNSCADGVKDGTETAVDCGAGCGGCGTGLACGTGGDCLSGVCSAGVCQSVPGGIHVVPAVQTDWGAGYCVTLQVTNANNVPTTNWTVTVDTNQSTLFNSWNGTFVGTGVITIKPSFSVDQVVAPGQTDGGLGFCANRTVAGSGRLPFVTSANGVF